MEKILIIVGLLIVVIILQIIYSGYYLNIGRRIAQNKFINKTELGDKTNPVVKLFISGDSVAVGVGASSFETSVAGRIGSFYAQKNYVQFENQAISGARMANLLKMPLPQEKQDVLILIISSNDLFYFTPLDQFKISSQKVIQRYLPLTDKLIIVGPGRVFDGQAVPIPLQLVYKARASEYENILKDLSAKDQKIVYLDPIRTPTDNKKYGKNTNAEDKFHPNDAGYEYWFDLIKPAL